ncbi:hypothetical protein C2G38_2189825 [Gigaspora rosea]|uniref:Uncharacterized protein n=1 Tax=Gigaspora rosea TaxID=44941 RepID=A0A397V262_9GLOM|nr:hypothetical protein C2G38_2189825 [Gigaspora rosea]
MGLIKTFLLTLNTEEQALLIPFKNVLPNGPKPLFEYIKSINNNLYSRIRNRLHDERNEIRRELENGIKYSLNAVFLRTDKKLKYLCLGEKYTLKDLNLNRNYLGSKGAKALSNALCKAITLSSLNFCQSNIGIEGGKTLVNAICKTTAFIFL